MTVIEATKFMPTTNQLFQVGAEAPWKRSSVRKRQPHVFVRSTGISLLRTSYVILTANYEAPYEYEVWTECKTLNQQYQQLRKKTSINMLPWQMQCQPQSVQPNLQSRHKLVRWWSCQHTIKFIEGFQKKMLACVDSVAVWVENFVGGHFHVTWVNNENNEN